MTNNPLLKTVEMILSLMRTHYQYYIHGEKVFNGRLNII